MARPGPIPTMCKLEISEPPNSLGIGSLHRPAFSALLFIYLSKIIHGVVSLTTTANYYTKKLLLTAFQKGEVYPMQKFPLPIQIPTTDILTSPNNLSHSGLGNPWFSKSVLAHSRLWSKNRLLSSWFCNGLISFSIKSSHRLRSAWFRMMMGQFWPKQHSNIVGRTVICWRGHCCTRGSTGKTGTQRTLISSGTSSKLVVLGRRRLMLSFERCRAWIALTSLLPWLSITSF